MSIWPASKQQNQKLEARLVAELHRIRDNLNEESRAELCTLKEAVMRVSEVAENFNASLPRMAAAIREFETRLRALEQRVDRLAR